MHNTTKPSSISTVISFNKTKYKPIQKLQKPQKNHIVCIYTQFIISTAYGYEYIRYIYTYTYIYLCIYINLCIYVLPMLPYCASCSLLYQFQKAVFPLNS